MKKPQWSRLNHNREISLEDGQYNARIRVQPDGWCEWEVQVGEEFADAGETKSLKEAKERCELWIKETRRKCLEKNLNL